MSWRAITKSDILPKLSQAEMDTIVAASDALDEDTLLDPAIAQVSGMVRGRVAAFRGNSLASDTTYVPDILIGVAVDILVYDITPATVLGTLDPDGKRQRAYDRAHTTLKDVANGSFSIDQPAEASSTAQGSNVGIEYSANDRHADRDTLQGL